MTKGCLARYRSFKVQDCSVVCRSRTRFAKIAYLIAASCPRRSRTPCKRTYHTRLSSFSLPKAASFSKKSSKTYYISRTSPQRSHICKTPHISPNLTTAMKLTLGQPVEAKKAGTTVMCFKAAFGNCSSLVRMISTDSCLRSPSR